MGAPSPKPLRDNVNLLGLLGLSDINQQSEGAESQCCLSKCCSLDVCIFLGWGSHYKRESLTKLVVGHPCIARDFVANIFLQTLASAAGFQEFVASALSVWGPQQEEKAPGLGRPKKEGLFAGDL